jgi:hypothetical protein
MQDELFSNVKRMLFPTSATRSNCNKNHWTIEQIILFAYHGNHVLQFLCEWLSLKYTQFVRSDTQQLDPVASALVWIFPNKAYTSKYYLWYCIGRIRLNGHFLLWNSTTVLIIYCTVIVFIMKYKIKEGMFSQTLNFVVVFCQWLNVEK